MYERLKQGSHDKAARIQDGSHQDTREGVLSARVRAGNRGQQSHVHTRGGISEEVRACE